MAEQPVLEFKEVTKTFGSVIALNKINAKIFPGEVTCLLGDNGAGKSTFIKTLSGIHKPDGGTYFVDGQPVEFNSPRDALAAGIATVYQDLALVPLMPIWRNFFAGQEPQRGFWPFRSFDVDFAKRIVREEMGKMSIDIRDPDQPVGTMSGGERQSLAIARAVYFGARVLILDEPTSALGVTQTGVVLRYIAQARARGLAVIFITHNPNHAYPIGDKFTILKRGQTLGTFAKKEISREEMITLMSGADELDTLAQELDEFSKQDHDESVKMQQLSDTEAEMADEVEAQSKIAAAAQKKSIDSSVD